MKKDSKKDSIQLELLSFLEPNEEFSITDAYNKVTVTDKKHSIRARIYEGVNKGLFEKVSRGVYKFIDRNENNILLIQGDGRDLSSIENDSIDCLVTDHPYSDPKSNKGGNRSFAEYETFLYTQKDFDEKYRVLKEGAFMVEFFAEENSNNFEYIFNCKKMAQAAGFEYYATVNWQKGSFVSNTGRKAKNTEQMVFFTKGEARSLKLDAKKNLAKAKFLNLDIKGLDSYGVAELLRKNGEIIHYMKGTAKMLPTVFNVDKTPKINQIHQAEKPVVLLEQLLEYITLPNETVLDQFSGSGNLGKACLNSNRNAVLIEKDEAVFSKLLSSIEEYVA